jgi:PEP-CTERM motif
MKTLRSLSTRTSWAGLALSLALAVPLPASVISENLTVNANSGVNPVAVGQSLTTPGGGPWDNIQFNFYLLDGSPYAEGTLYLLSQEYTGPLAALNAATPGFLASTSTISGGVWQFAGLTLQPNTEYFFQSGTVSTTARTFHSGPVLDGGIMYATSVIGSNYLAIPNQDMAFTLQGTATGVPEPGTLWLLGTAVTLAWRRAQCRTARYN